MTSCAILAVEGTSPIHFPRYIRDYRGELWQIYKDIWEHACEGHPEIRPHLDKVEEAIRDPDEVRQSRKKIDSVLFYKRYPVLRVFHYRDLNNWCICVVGDRADHDIDTAFIVQNPKPGETIWTKG